VKAGTVSRAEVFQSRRFTPASEARGNGATRQGDFREVKGLAGWILAKGRATKKTSRNRCPSIPGAQPSHIQRDGSRGARNVAHS